MYLEFACYKFHANLYIPLSKATSRPPGLMLESADRQHAINSSRMADPFSFAASVVGVAVAALQTSKKLHSLVQDFTEAPGQLKMLAEQIERDATFLKCAVELICDHEALFRDELVGLVRDIHGQFANIHELIKKLSPRSRSRKLDRFKKLVTALWNSKKIENIIVQLEALRTTLALILGIAQYAEQRASRYVLGMLRGQQRLICVL